MNITLLFKEKHLCCIANQISFDALSSYFVLASRIRETLRISAYQPDDMVSIVGTVDEIVNIYTLFGRKPEGVFRGINNEISTLLTSQITSKITNSNDPENASAIDLATRIQNIETKNAASLADFITRGRQMLMS